MLRPNQCNFSDRTGCKRHGFGGCGDGRPIQINEKCNIEIEWGEDISTDAYRKLAKILPEYYYITHWPYAIKPFYIMPSEDNRYSESFDLQKGMLELTSGGTRVHNRKQLEDALAKNFEQIADVVKVC